MKTLRLVWNKVKEKLKERSGETIVETLVSMLIVVLAVVMLAGSIVAAARVNAGAEDHTVYLNETDTPGIEDSGPGVKVSFNGVPTDAKVKSYTKKKDDGTSSGKLFYYEFETE